jgi:hypothetical protein
VREGLLAEFDDPVAMVRALGKLREKGYAELDVYAPHPVEGVREALSFARSRVARYTLTGGVLGALTGYVGQWWIAVIDYPLNVGGRPLHSAPAFIPITFELTILFASLATVLGFFLEARLGALWAPVDEAPGIESASVDAFWLAVGVSEHEAREVVEQQVLEEGAKRVVGFGGVT